MWKEREPRESSRILRRRGLSRQVARRARRNGVRFGSVRARILILSNAPLRAKRRRKKSNFFIFRHWERYQCWKIKMATRKIVIP